MRSPNNTLSGAEPQARLSRRERDKLRHREIMMQAAVELFSEKGYHNVSMQEIAQRAEFAIGTLYSLFVNKEDLYRALMREMSDRFAQARAEALADPGDEMDKIRAYLRSKQETMEQNVKIVRLYIAETRGASFNLRAGLDAELTERYEAGLKELAKVFRSGIRRGLFRKMDPYLMAVALDSLANTSLLMSLREPDGRPYEDTMDAMSEIFFEQVRVS